MKALNHYLVYFISIIVLFSSCDIVEEPFVITYEVSDSCDAQTFVENSQIPKQKVLLEDYTGHQCGNCPRAAEMAHILKDSIYGDQLIILTVHAGWFSRTSDDYPTDYSTEVGNDWDAFFGNSAAGNPNGMINRINYPNGHIYQHTQWSQKIEEQLLSPPSIEIKIHANFNAAANLICIDTQTEILNQSNSDLSITVVLIEDSLIALSNIILKLCIDIKYAKQLGENAFYYYQQFCTISNMVKGIQDAIEGTNFSKIDNQS